MKSIIRSLFVLCVLQTSCTSLGELFGDGSDETQKITEEQENLDEQLNNSLISEENDIDLDLGDDVSNPDFNEESLSEDEVALNEMVTENVTDDPIKNVEANPVSGEDIQETEVVEEISNPQTAEEVVEPVQQATADTPSSEAEVDEQVVQSDANAYYEDVLPTYHQLSWVGYELSKKQPMVYISAVVGGNPEYEIFQEQNRSAQPELVLRLFQTSLRKKLKWDIDASEFRSPVAYVRMRENEPEGYVDVVLTLRDVVEGHLKVDGGKFALSFPIPEAYFGNKKVDPSEIDEKAIAIGNAELSLILDKNSTPPRNLGSSGDLEPGGESVNDVMAPNAEFDSEGLPENFSEVWIDELDRDQFVVRHISYLSVGQDNGNVEDFTDDMTENMDEEAVEYSEDLEAQSPQSSAVDEKLIYLEFTDTPLSLVFKSFSDATGNNFIFPRSIGELSVSIHFKGVPWDEALKAVLETHSLGMVRVGESVVRVDAVDKLTNYMKALEQAQQFETRRSPTKILVFRLNNAKADDVKSRIDELLVRDKQVDPRIQISADLRTNSIVMEAPDYILAKTKNVVERLDLKTPQVEIASRIVEVQKANSDLFGFSWLNQSLLSFDPGRGLGFGSLNFPNSVTSRFSVDPGVRGAPSVGNAQFKFGSINKFIDLDLLLRMEERRGTTNVLQSNKVLVLDGKEATILAGNSKFFRPAAGAVGAAGEQGEAPNGLSEVRFDLSLKVKPQVTAAGSVIMDLDIKSDTPGSPTGEALADKNTRELTTQMVRDSGDTGVIGGIYDTSKTESIIGIPFLSSLPIIGALFRSTVTEESQTELLIMVTPTIISHSKTDEISSADVKEEGNVANF